MRPRRIVSGGQTGVDRAALEVALELGIEIGGWVPKGRLAEDGTIADRFVGLDEAPSSDPAVRTSLNVRDADATLILSRGAPVGGSRLTLDEAVRLRRPHLHLDLAASDDAEAAERLGDWFRRVAPSTLNVAGPRASDDRTIADRARAVLLLALR